MSWVQGIQPNAVDGRGPETSHIIVTKVSGKNGQPKEVQPYVMNHDLSLCVYIEFSSLNAEVNVLSTIYFTDIEPWNL